MMKIKKTCSILLALLMLVSVFGMTALAVEAEEFTAVEMGVTNFNLTEILSTLKPGETAVFTDGDLTTIITLYESFSPFYLDEEGVSPRSHPFSFSRYFLLGETVGGAASVRVNANGFWESQNGFLIITSHSVTVIDTFIGGFRILSDVVENNHTFRPFLRLTWRTTFIPTATDLINFN